MQYRLSRRGISRASLRFVAMLASVAACVMARPAAARAQDPGAEPSVYLLTMGPGDQVWEKFGHNAIWIHDPVRGTDRVYNWGIFDMSEPGFMRRFLKGRMRYWMQPMELDRTLYEYSYFNRSVYAQELNMTPAQKQALQEFVTWNAQAENRYYLYDYFRDNCSTRVRDALDRALGGVIRQTLEPRETGTTYRWHTRLLLGEFLPLYTGIQLGLGENTDEPLNAWEEGFLPLRLRDQIRNVMVFDSTGAAVPLVKSERTLFEAQRPPLPTEPPNRLIPFLIVGLLVGGVLAGLGYLGRRSKLARFGFFTLALAWTLVVGIFGTIINLLWLATDHWATYRNENVLQANFLFLVLFVCLTGMAFRARWAGTKARHITLIIAGLATLGFFIQVIPGVDQVNGEIIALLLPATLGLASRTDRD